MTPPRRLVTLLLAAAASTALVGLAGCSQVAAIAPVGGGHEAEVRFAVNDVLVERGVEIMTAPVCETTTDGTVECAGTTADGADITASAPAGDPATLMVSAGSAQLYSGPLQDVLDRAARSAS